MVIDTDLTSACDLLEAYLNKITISIIIFNVY
jgi:hypothetical protein